MRLRFGVGRGVGAELHHQPSTAFRKHGKAVEVHAFVAARIDHDVVKTFEANGAMLHDSRNVVSADINVGPSDDEKYARRRTLDEAAGGLENGDARSFGANESAGYVKAVFRKQVIEVVSRNATRDVRKLAADLLSVAIGQIS